MVIAVVLSLLLPGLGHAYSLHLPRALVWFGGTILVGLVLNGGEENTALALWMAGALAVLAALDVVLAMWLDSRPSGRR
ncbi:MAG: hypothetical protein JHC74_04275 [Thermoleophilia bacterium]|nr:hypothetical protein [Thermoleophilia bacterium]